jgi:hypothetical protein
MRKLLHSFDGYDHKRIAPLRTKRSSSFAFASATSRAFPQATTSSSGKFLAVTSYISSGVWPANAECRIFALCSSTKKAISVSR